MPERPSQRSPCRGAGARLRAIVLGAAVLLLAGSPLQGQFRLRAPSGEALTLDSASVREMLRESRRLRSVLEEDPAVLYYVGSGPAATLEEPASAYPWRAVLVRNDSVARVAFPANYREGDRAYYNYAVRKMEMIRSLPPAVRCSTAVAREVELASSFTDGWVVARTLFGGPAFAPLDAFAFAREAGHLRAMVVELGSDALGGCVRRWAREHPDEIEAYRAWRTDRFEAPGSPGERSLQTER